MPKLRNQTPKYSHHRASGQALVRIHGKCHYLGPYGSPESRARYDALVADFLARHRQQDAGLTIGQLCALYWRHCKQKYGHQGRGQFGYAQDYRPILRLIRQYFAKMTAASFGPKSLRRLQEEGIKAGWARTNVNRHIGRARRMFKWAAAEELLPISIYQTLMAVDPLRLGDCREAETRDPLSDETVERTIPFVRNQVVRDMIALQRLSGCRPGEVCRLTVGDVDRSGDVWKATLERHKTAHRGKRRTLYFGPQSQAILAKYLLKEAERFVFESKGKRGYCNDSYRRAIWYACQKGHIPTWSPQMIRKAAAQHVRDVFDVESAAAMLGHCSSVVTQDHYAKATQERAETVAKKLG